MARILLRTKYNLVLNETFNLWVNGEELRVKIVKDSQGPLRITMPKISENKFTQGSSDSDSISEYNSNGWHGEEDLE